MDVSVDNTQKIDWKKLNIYMCSINDHLFKEGQTNDRSDGALLFYLIDQP